MRARNDLYPVNISFLLNLISSMIEAVTLRLSWGMSSALDAIEVQFLPKDLTPKPKGLSSCQTKKLSLLSSRFWHLQRHQ